MQEADTLIVTMQEVLAIAQSSQVAKEVKYMAYVLINFFRHVYLTS
jgi:hypothetical protein